MKVLTKIIEHEYGDSFPLIFLTDTHLGAAACDEALLDRDIATIKAMPNARWIFGGDGIDAIMEVGDKRFKPSSIASWVFTEVMHGNDDIIGIQGDYLVKKLSPIAPQCLGFMKGNHCEYAEDRYRHMVYWDMVREIAKAGDHRWQDLALGKNGFINLKFHRMAGGSRQRTWQKTVYLHHGYGGGGTVSGAVNKLNKAMSRIEADLIFFGHLHLEATNPVRIMRAAGNSIKYEDRFGFFVASYLNAHVKPSDPEKGRPVDTYAESKGYEARKLGTFPVVLSPDADNIEYYKSIRPGLDNIAALRPFWDNVGIKGKAA